MTGLEGTHEALKVPLDAVKVSLQQHIDRSHMHNESLAEAARLHDLMLILLQGHARLAHAGSATLRLDIGACARVQVLLQQVDEKVVAKELEVVEEALSVLQAGTLAFLIHSAVGVVGAGTLIETRRRHHAPHVGAVAVSAAHDPGNRANELADFGVVVGQPTVANQAGVVLLELL